MPHHATLLLPPPVDLQVSGYVREICQQMTQTVPKAIVHCMVLQVRPVGGGDGRMHVVERWLLGVMSTLRLCCGAASCLARI